MTQEFAQRSITIYHNDSAIKTLDWGDYCDQIREIIESNSVQGLPILVIMYGMPGSGKTHLSHMLSEKILHCLIWEKDFVYSIGLNHDINKIKSQYDDGMINKFCSYVVDFFLKTIRCNIIIPANCVEQLKILKKYEEGYNKFVIAFNRIRIEDSATHNVHGLSKEQIMAEYGKWKTYEELLMTGEI